MIGVKERLAAKSFELQKENLAGQLAVYKEVAPLQPASTLTVEQRFKQALAENSPMKVVGRATWVDLHTRAANFPPSPSPDDEELMKAHILSSVASLPCSACASTWMGWIEANPIDTSSRGALKAWLCKFHNAVNEKLAKPVIKCAP